MVAYPQTANFKLTLPPFDTRAYDSLVNDNFKAIDAIVATYFALSNVQGTWQNSTAYVAGDKLVDGDVGLVFQCVISHTSLASPSTFEEERTAQPTYWTAPAIPARGLGVWSSGQTYEPGDFVVASNIYYAVCIASHMSGASFLGDSAFWDILIDLTGVGTIPATAGHALQYTRVNAGASGLEYVPVSTMIVDMALGTLAFSSFVLGSIASQAANNVTITGGHITGITDLAIADGGTGSSTAANARTALGLGTAAVANTGVSAGNVVVLDVSAKLPAVDGSQLTGIISKLLGIFGITYSTNADLSTNVPYDDTIPTNVEGDLLDTQSITTTTSTQKVLCMCSGVIATSSQNIAVTLYRDGVALRTTGFAFGAAGGTPHIPFAFMFLDAPGAAGTYSYTVRGGADSGNVRFNGDTAGRKYGGKMGVDLICLPIEP